MAKKTPEQLAEEFLAKPLELGSRCKTCKLANIKEIDRALRKINDMKKSGETSHDWVTIHKHFLVEQYNYPYVVQSMRNHMKDCLGL